MSDDAEMTSARTVAEFMVTLIPQGRGQLAQERASAMIRKQFGIAYVQKNKNGNWGIRPDVLKEFNSLTREEPNDLVWIMSSQTWRRRQVTDAPGRLAKRLKPTS